MLGLMGELAVQVLAIMALACVMIILSRKRKYL